MIKSRKYSVLAAGAGLVFAWLMPNHQLPWTTFHSDLMVAVSLSLLSIFFLMSIGREEVELSDLHFSVLALALFSLLYKIFGRTDYWTVSLLPALYFLGFFLALCVGRKLKEFEGEYYPTLVWYPPLIAAIISVGLQLAQWLFIPEYGPTDIWISSSNGVRPAANMNQPNQLATLLLWGCLSAIYLCRKNIISSTTVFVVLVYLCLGLGLTLSRTGVLNYCLISLLFLIAFRGNIGVGKFVGWILVTVVYLCSWNLHDSLPVWLSLPGAGEAKLAGLNRDNGVRLTIWHMFFDAVWSKPILGYGPLMNLQAQYTQLVGFTQLSNTLYANSHNIVLEFCLWFGIPVAVVVAVIWARWFVKLLRSVCLRAKEDLYSVSLLLVMFVHASLELPLHHAYFLLPVGLVVGGLLKPGEFFFSGTKVLVSARILLGISIFSLSCVLAVAVEYFDIEEQVTAFRFKEANIANSANPVIPNSFFLDQLSDQLKFNAHDANARVSDKELDSFRKYVNSYTHCDAVDKLRKVLLTHEKTEEAEVLRVSLSERCKPL